MLGIGLDIKLADSAGVVRDFSTKSILLDGVDEYINTNTLRTAIASNTTGTISVWVKPVDATPSSIDRLVSFGDTNANEFFTLFISTAGKLGAALGIAGVTQWNIQTDAVACSDNTWCHFALVVNGTLPVLYVNGVAVAQTTITSTDTTKWLNSATGLDNGRIGCLNYNNLGNTGFFNGNIDDFVYTTAALNASQVSAIYNSGKPKDESALTGGVSYYRFGDGTGDNWNSGVSSEWQFIDQIGSNNCFTVNCEESDVENDTP